MTTAIREEETQLIRYGNRYITETTGVSSPPFNRGLTISDWATFWATNDTPPLSSAYDEQDPILRSVAWHSALLGRDKVNGVPTTIVCHLLELTPVIQIALMKPRYYRPAMIRESYLLLVFNIDPEKIWRHMDDHRAREEITNVLNTMLTMRRLGIKHEGFEAAIGQWMETNKK